MIQMKVTDEQVCGFFLGDITIYLCNAVPGIKDDIEFFGLDEHRTGIPGNGIIPTIGSQEGNFHVEHCLVGWAKKIEIHDSRLFIILKIGARAVFLEKE